MNISYKQQGEYMTKCVLKITCLFNEWMKEGSGNFHAETHCHFPFSMP